MGGTASTRARTITGLGALLLCAMACSENEASGNGSADDGAAFQDGGNAPEPLTSPEDTVRALIEARAAGDGPTACSLYTDDYAAEELLEADDEDANTCAQAVTSEGPEDYYQDEIVRVAVTDTAPGFAEVGVTYDSNPGVASYSLELVQNSWKVRSLSTD